MQWAGCLLWDEIGVGRCRSDARRMQACRRFDKRMTQGGFTLVELVVVVIIIGILACVSIPLYYHQVGVARLAANQSNAHTAVVHVETLYDKPSQADIEETIRGRNKHMYFRYDTQTGEATYLGVDTRSPGQGVTYQHFANVGYKAAGGQGTTVIGEWNSRTPSKLDNGQMSTTVLTDRVYRYWDIAVQGDWDYIAIVCLW